MAVNSTSTGSPPPRIGHGCMWVEWSGTHICCTLTIRFLFVIRNIFHTQFESSRGLRSFLGDLLGDASSAALVYSSIKRQLLPLISPALFPCTHANAHAQSLRGDISCLCARFLWCDVQKCCPLSLGASFFDHRWKRAKWSKKLEWCRAVFNL